MEARIKGTNDPFMKISGIVLDLGIKEGKCLILKPEEVEFNSVEFEKMYEASEEIYDKEYSHGEYCHEQSFKWGFQEGVDFIERLLSK